RLHVERVEEPTAPAGGVRRVLRGALAGLPATIVDRAWAVSVLAWSALFVTGANEVLVVAIAFDLLGLSDSGPGLLTACVGFGGIVGAAAMSRSAGRRLGRWLLAAAAVIGAPLVLTAAVSIAGVVAVLLAVLGGGLAVTVVAGQTQLQRVV